jgi:hypothetical protein
MLQKHTIFDTSVETEHEPSPNTSLVFFFSLKCFEAKTTHNKRMKNLCSLAMQNFEAASPPNPGG